MTEGGKVKADLVAEHTERISAASGPA